MPPKDAAVEVVVDTTPKPPTVDELMTAFKVVASRHTAAQKARVDAEQALNDLVARQEDLRKAVAKAKSDLDDALELLRSGG